MSDTLVLFLPVADVPWRWLRIADSGVRARGEGFPSDLDPDAPPPVAVVPAGVFSVKYPVSLIMASAEFTP